MTEYGDVRPVSKISEIVVLDLLEEGTGIQGFAFSRKFISAPDFMKYSPQKTQAEQRLIRSVADKAWKAAEESTGGPCAGEDYVSISISDDHPNASSKMEKTISTSIRNRNISDCGGMIDQENVFQRARLLVGT